MSVLPMPSRDRAELRALEAQHRLEVSVAAHAAHGPLIKHLIEIAEDALARARRLTPEDGDAGAGTPTRRSGVLPGPGIPG